MHAQRTKKSLPAVATAVHAMAGTGAPHRTPAARGGRTVLHIRLRRPVPARRASSPGGPCFSLAPGFRRPPLLAADERSKIRGRRITAIRP